MYLQIGDAALDVQVVVSELVTNAIRADCHRLSLALEGHHSYVRIATTDDGPGVPVKLEPAPDQNHGRGLQVVDALSSRWGFDHEARGKTVWADLPLSGDLGATFECEN
jgi:anti-sigma regulatory factor (Ser/Thr protein kinase)